MDIAVVCYFTLEPHNLHVNFVCCCMLCERVHLWRTVLRILRFDALNYMQQILYWEGADCPVSQEISHILWFITVLAKSPTGLMNLKYRAFCTYVLWHLFSASRETVFCKEQNMAEVDLRLRWWLWGLLSCEAWHLSLVECLKSSRIRILWNVATYNRLYSITSCDSSLQNWNLKLKWTSDSVCLQMGLAAIKCSAAA